MWIFNNMYMPLSRNRQIAEDDNNFKKFGSTHSTVHKFMYSIFSVPDHFYPCPAIAHLDHYSSEKRRTGGMCISVTSHCNSSTAFQVNILCLSFGLTSIGVGGIRSASSAFGADQFIKRYNKQTSLATLESYFGWYYAASVLAVIVYFSFVPYIQEHFGWQVGFGVPSVFMLLGADI